MDRTRKTLIVLVIALIPATAGFSGDHSKPIPDPMVGTWSLEGRSACKERDADRVVFRQDGTFQNQRRGRVEALGYWELEDDQLHLHALTSPAFLDDRLAHFAGSFHYLKIRGLITEGSSRELRVVASYGDQMEELEFHRCSTKD